MTENAGYPGLRQQIESLLTDGRQFSRQAAEWEKIETYWFIGDAIQQHLQSLGGPERGDETVRNLSKDLHLGLTTLYEILRFRRCISSFHARENIGWSHYKALMHLPPERMRHYEQLADDNAWTTRQLKRAIDADSDTVPVDDGLPAVSPLRAYFGDPYTYRVVEDAVPPAHAPAIDFGFHQVVVPDARLQGFETTCVGDVVTVDPVSGKATVRAGRPQLWTYVAYVRRVIDGDTLDVVIDLGLGQRAFPRIRLRGIDTPELYTDAGRRAREFVEAKLAVDDMIVVATRRTDTYGRYLGDVKYLDGNSDPGEVLGKGIYLNRQLLDEGLARRYLG